MTDWVPMSAVDDLKDELREAEAENGRLREQRDQIGTASAEWQEAYVKARAERDRLRAALERHHRPYAPLTRPCDICGVDPTEAPERRKLNPYALEGGTPP